MGLQWRTARDGARRRADRGREGPGDLGFRPEFVAESNETVVGWCRNVWWDESDGTRLYLLLGSVDPAYRRRGAFALLRSNHRRLDHGVREAGMPTAAKT
jgi:hypothetical protein